MPTQKTRSKTQESAPLLKDQAYSALKQQILDETHAPGTFLSERKLAQSMKLGLTPIRQALQRLGAEGFLRISPRQGAYVMELTVEEILDVYEIRKVLEPYAIRKIAGKLKPEQMQAIQENMEQQRLAKDAQDVRTTVHLDMEFHSMLTTFAGNSEIMQVMQRLRDKVYRIIIRSARYDFARLERSWEEHGGIVQALQEGDPERAAKAMEQHLEQGKRFVLLR